MEPERWAAIESVENVMLLTGSLLYLTGRTPSPFPTEPEHVLSCSANRR
jgi:hypothetical protein